MGTQDTNAGGAAPGDQGDAVAGRLREQQDHDRAVKRVSRHALGQVNSQHKLTDARVAATSARSGHSEKTVREVLDALADVERRNSGN